MGAGIEFLMATATLQPTSVTKTFKSFPPQSNKTEAYHLSRVVI